MLLTPDQEMIRDAVRNFAQTELWPHAARHDKVYTVGARPDNSPRHIV